MQATDLTTAEYAPYYAGYVGLTAGRDLPEALNESAVQLVAYLEEAGEARRDHAYAPGKWTVGQCLQHVIDSERVFAYRALRIGRGDKTPLPGFDQDEFAAVARVDHRTLAELTEAFRTVRQATVQLFAGFTAADLERMGTMSGGPASVRALGFIIAGHAFHHERLYREKYG